MSEQEAKYGDQPGHPMQPLIRDAEGTLRFKGNAIVRFLLDAGPYDMNQLAMIPFRGEDRVQFAQLIGYTLGGFGDLSYVSDEAYKRASGQAKMEAMQEDVVQELQRAIARHQELLRFLERWLGKFEGREEGA